MNYYEFLLMIRRFRWMYLAILIITFSGSFFLLRPHILTFRGLTIFYLANESTTSPAGFMQKGQDEIMYITLNKERISQLVYSNEMLNYMIEKFNLYEHYGIDTTQVYHYEKIVKRLSLAISFTKVTPDMFQISVIDKNNIIAANMTNEVVLKLDELNQKYLLDKIQANLSFFESYLETSVKTSQEQNEKLFEYMEILNHQRQSSNKNISSPKPLSEIEFALFQAATKIEDVTTQLIEARNLYSKAIYSRQSNNLPNLIVVKKALPELNTKIDQLVFFASLVAMLSASTIIVIMFLFFNFKTDLQIVFGKNLPDKVPHH